MGTLEMILTFIFAMTILMIPILAILRRPAKRPPVEDGDLARRLGDLEAKSLEREREIAGLRRDLSFLQRLLEDKREPRP